MEFLEFTVSGNGHGVREAVTATEELGKSAGLGRKESLRLRLLAEELLGMVQSITGNLEAKYRAEQDGNDYRLMLYGSVDLTPFFPFLQQEKMKRQEALWASYVT